jgi:hypothetical protein
LTDETHKRNAIKDVAFQQASAFFFKGNHLFKNENHQLLSLFMTKIATTGFTKEFTTAQRARISEILVFLKGLSAALTVVHYVLSSPENIPILIPACDIPYLVDDTTVFSGNLLKNFNDPSHHSPPPSPPPQDPPKSLPPVPSPDPNPPDSPPSPKSPISKSNDPASNGAFSSKETS